MALIFRIFNDDWEKESLGTNTNDSESSVNEIRDKSEEEEDIAVDFRNNEIVPLGVEGSVKKRKKSWFTFNLSRSPHLGGSRVTSKTPSFSG